jgi:hypothetical protein
MVLQEMSIKAKLLYEDKYLNLYDTAGITSQDEQFSKLAYEKNTASY